MSRRIIFAYNVDSGFFNAVGEEFKKIFSPRNYPCNLYFLTVKNGKLKPEWQDFLGAITNSNDFDVSKSSRVLGTVSVKVDFRYRNQIIAQLKGIAEKLPAVFLEDINGQISLIIDHNEIDRCIKLDDLIELVKKKLEQHKIM